MSFNGDNATSNDKQMEFLHTLLKFLWPSQSGLLLQPHYAIVGQGTPEAVTRSVNIFCVLSFH